VKEYMDMGTEMIGALNNILSLFKLSKL